MNDDVLATRRAVERSIADCADGDGIVVAVSGGADSLALARAAAAVATRRHLRATCVVIDHGLQPGSADAAEVAAATCRSMGLPARIIPVTVTRTGAGLEADARDARRSALVEAACADGSRVILLGHTRDDQAETVLLRLARGSGARSLSAMAPRVDRDGLSWRRPLLGIRRDVVRRSLEGLAAWEDPHNCDERFARVRVRALMPDLAAAAGEGVVDGLARSAEMLRADADALDEWAASAIVGAMTVTASGTVLVVVDMIAGLPVAVRTRVLRRAAVVAGSPPGALGHAHVMRVDALVSDWHGQGEAALPGITARREHGTLILAPIG